MTKLTVLQFPDPRLKKVATPITDFNKDLQKNVSDMLETMYHLNGVGLAATQVNIHQRIIVIDCSEKKDEPLVIINPQITTEEGTIFWEEGCLSFPGIYAKVRRHEHVIVDFQDQFGKQHTVEAHDLLAVCLQHEIDHINGITFYDHLSTLKQKLLKKKIKKMHEEFK